MSDQTNPPSPLSNEFYDLWQQMLSETKIHTQQQEQLLKQYKTHGTTDQVTSPGDSSFFTPENMLMGGAGAIGAGLLIYHRKSLAALLGIGKILRGGTTGATAAAGTTARAGAKTGKPWMHWLGGAGTAGATTWALDKGADMAKKLSGDIVGLNRNTMDADQMIRNIVTQSGINPGNRTTEQKHLTKNLDIMSALGMKYAEIQDMVIQLNEQSHTTAEMNSGNLRDMAAITKGLDITSAETAKLTSQFLMVGKPIAETRDMVEATMKDAEKMGLSGRKVILEMSEHFKTFQRVSFKSEESMRRMVMYSKKAGVNINSMMDFGDKVMDLEGAVEMAANMNVMGGSMSGMDPLTMMYESMYDPEALEKRVLGAIQKDATFRTDKNGKQVLTGASLRMIKEQSKITGISQDELIETAYRGNNMKRLKKQIGGGFSEEELEELSGMVSQGRGGKFMLKTSSMGDKEISGMTPTEVRAMMKTRNFEEEGGYDLERWGARRQGVVEKTEAINAAMASAMMPYLSRMFTGLDKDSDAMKASFDKGGMDQLKYMAEVFADGNLEQRFGAIAGLGELLKNVATGNESPEALKKALEESAAMAGKDFSPAAITQAVAEQQKGIWESMKTDNEAFLGYAKHWNSLIEAIANGVAAGAANEQSIHITVPVNLDQKRLSTESYEYKLSEQRGVPK